MASNRKSGTRSVADRSTTSSSDPLAEDYLRWLGQQMRDQDSAQGESFEGLFRIMFEKEFVPLIDHDDNRVIDGRDLRSEFCYQNDLPTNYLNNTWPISFLEVLIGLSRRLAFVAGGQAPGWAWQLLGNLELTKMADPLTRRKARQVETVLETCIRRTYTPDGQGGFFPLAWPDEDQRQVELWYQMAAYVGELHPEHG
jgi:hypothetical protein